MNIAPSTAFEATLEAAITGLVGTIQLGIIDNEGNYTQPLDDADIIETPAGSGFYVAQRTSPDTGGQYTLLWSLDGTTDPDQIATEELVVGFTALSPTIDGPAYATVEQLAAKLKVNAVTHEADLTRVLLASKIEIDTEIGYSLTEDNTADEVALATSVNLARAQDWWLLEGLPVGVIGLGGETPMFTPRDSWARHANNLAPLKNEWGLA